LGNAPRLVVDTTTAQVNSFALPTQNEVHIFLNLAELISDSESELAFVVGHEVGHIIQSQNNRLLFSSGNIEWDADEIGMLLSLLAGYDPYGAAGALAKLAMASGSAGLIDQNFDNLATSLGLDPHGSFNDRLALIFGEMQSLCALPQAQTFCAQYKDLVHPHLPPGAPLRLPPPRK
jgi:predicted Zn-dependent protease